MDKKTIKPGYKTTEAWARLLASIFFMINHPPPACRWTQKVGST